MELFNLTQENRFTGTVLFYDALKGFGKIRCQSLNTDLFVHASGLDDFIKSGDRISFIIAQKNGNLEAIQVQGVQEL